MTRFIAEICSNHNGDLLRALALIDKAAEIGCEAVKFQLFRIDQLFAPEALDHPDYQFLQERRQWELPLHWLPVLKARCLERGIEFGCTPFYLDAVEELLPFVDFYKVASYSLLHTDLLRAIARTRKPVILSTGMATLDEIDQAQEILVEEGGVNQLTLLHCVSSYPTPPGDCLLGLIYRLTQYYSVHIFCGKITIGWSDHSVSPGVIYAAVLMNEAKTIEFHLDLDGKGDEYKLGHCWLPEQMKDVIQNIKVAQSAGNDLIKKEFSEPEQQERLWRADPDDGLRPLKEVREKLR